MLLPVWCVHALLPVSGLLLLPVLSHGQGAARPRHDTCLDGMLTVTGGVNREAHLCGAIAQANPEVAAQLGQILRVLAGNQEQMKQLTRNVNTLGRRLDATHQQEMIQSVVIKIGTNPATISAKAGYLNTALDGLTERVETVGSDPASAAVLQSRLQGQLGDSIAQLDTGMAMAELSDIRSEVHKIDTTTTRTDQNVRDIQHTIDMQLHPERALSPEQGRLYTQMSPLMMDTMTFMTRWQTAEFKDMQQHGQERAAEAAKARAAQVGAAGSFSQTVASGYAPLLATYQQELLPQLNAWRTQLIQRVSNLGDIPAFPTATDPSGVRGAQDRVRILLQRYATGDPHPSPELARQGHELQARLANLDATMQQARARAGTDLSQQRAAAYQQYQIAIPTSPGQTYVESVDGPMRQEFLQTLEPKLREWQSGAKRFYPAFQVVNFSEVKTSGELRDAQIRFNGEAMHVYNQLSEQVRNAH